MYSLGKRLYEILTIIMFILYLAMQFFTQLHCYTLFTQYNLCERGKNKVGDIDID